MKVKIGKNPEVAGLPVNAVIMAGGAGTRLHPKTLSLPKPLLPIKNTPLIERIVVKLKEAKIRDVYISTFYRANNISEYFKKKKMMGINIHFLNEQLPRGTAGSLELMKESKYPLLVFNGDILTNLDLVRFFHHHQANKADLTLATHEMTTQSPYGVIEASGSRLKRLVEKPKRVELVNAGIYIIEPRLCRYIPKGKRYDMVDLIKKSIEAGDRIFCFNFKDFWTDIGSLENYKQVNGIGEESMS